MLGMRSSCRSGSRSFIRAAELAACGARAHTRSMADSLPWHDGRDDRRGWDRASIANRSAKPYRPSISRQDLMLPNEAGKAKALALCSICALCMTCLYVLIPLYICSVFVDLGAWAAVILAAALVTFTAFLFIVSVREDRELRVLAREL